MRLRRSKYGAVPTYADGIRFASKKEARRYQELKLLEKAGEVHRLECQPVYVLHAYGTGQKIGEYRGDFQYCECDQRNGRCWSEELVVEDVKSGPTKTALYRWKKKHVEAQYGITIREV